MTVTSENTVSEVITSSPAGDIHLTAHEWRLFAVGMVAISEGYWVQGSEVQGLDVSAF
jgi:hypothetical protein